MCSFPINVLVPQGEMRDHWQVFFFTPPLTCLVSVNWVGLCWWQAGQCLLCSPGELQVEALTHRVLIDRPPQTNVSTFLILAALNGRYALGLICSCVLNCLLPNLSLQLQNTGSGLKKKKRAALSLSSTSLGIWAAKRCAEEGGRCPSPHWSRMQEKVMELTYRLKNMKWKCWCTHGLKKKRQ